MAIDVLVYQKRHILPGDCHCTVPNVLEPEMIIIENEFTTITLEAIYSVRCTLLMDVAYMSFVLIKKCVTCVKINMHLDWKLKIRKMSL